MNGKNEEKLLKRRKLFVTLCTIGAVGTTLVAKKDDIAHAAPEKKSAVFQENWRWCNKCQGLFFAGNSRGVCPAGGTHNSGGSGNYGLLGI